ncbi:hypothetical protein D6C83_05266 [Aureobasidium pullulans]|uniref:Cell wall alpha-1,3-glucan synthase Mok11-14/Ags1-like transmembrane domain-containing protein n=1 Tax=Aureobasidium pullulans TaxID=5580 RepID=A0A4V4LHB2_AURPU|nr:hypothetical protein D6C83_05266 [Aureobasidium pullulans]
MFALNRLTASAFHVFRYRSAPAIQSFWHGFTSTSSNYDDDKKQWRREYNARYYLENRERLREAKSKQYHKNIEKSRQKNNDYLDKMEKEDPERLERRVRQIREILASKYRDPEWRQRELIRRKQQYHALSGVGIGTMLLQTLTRHHVAVTLTAAQVLGSIATIAARASSPDATGPGAVFPNLAVSLAGLGAWEFWVALLFQLVLPIGFLMFFRNEQLFKP